MGLSPYLLVLPTADTLSPPQLTVCAALRRGVVLTSRSRPLVPLDLARFDYVIGMDEKNTRAIKVSCGVVWHWCARLLSLLPPPLCLITLHCPLPQEAGAHWSSFSGRIGSRPLLATTDFQ